MEYIRFGKGKKPFVILPGLSVQSVIPMAAAIEKRYEIFCEGFSVYLFDRRADLPEEYSVFDMADDTAEAMKALRIENACIFGASQGGMIAMALAVKYPALAGCVELGSTAAYIDETKCRAINEWIALAEAGNAEGLYTAFGEKVYPPEMFAQLKDAFVSAAKTVNETDLKRFITLAKGTKGFDIRKELQAIKCPVLAIGDTDDAVLGGNATVEIEVLMKENPAFETYMYSGFGHAAYDAAPDYTQRLYDFAIKNLPEELI